MILVQSFESILSIILIFMVGYFMARAGWIDIKTGGIFSKIIINVALPCYLFWNMTTDFSKSRLISESSGLIVPFLSIGLSYLLAIVISNIMKVRKGRKGVFRSIFFNSNTIFIGLAVNIALFGEKSIPYALLYYIANTVFFWIFGIYEIQKDVAPDKVLFSKENLKQTISPPLKGFIIAVIFIMLNIHIPEFILNTCRYIGQLATPLGLFFIGIILYSVKLKELCIDRDLIALTLARFVICPLLVILLEQIFVLPGIMAKVFIIQSAMPAMTITGVVAKEYGADYEFGTIATVVTTILSMIVIPIYMFII